MSDTNPSPSFPLVPLLGPLALTAAFGATGILHASTPVTVVAMIVMVAGWLGFAAWLVRRDASPRSDELLSLEQHRLMTELREFVAREVGGARDELDRSRALIREAIGELHGSFRSLEEQSRQQGATITGLVEQGGSGSPGVHQFADSAGLLIGKLAKTMADDSGESVKTVQAIDKMAARLDGIFDLLNDLKALAEHAAEVAGNADAQSAQEGSDARRALRVVADEVRNLSERSAAFDARIRTLVSESKEAVGHVRERVEETADREMNTSIEAKTEADALLQQVTTINRSLAQGIRAVSDASQQIRADVARAVRSMQFEDITSQALTAANVHIERLGAINQDATQLQQALTETHGGPQARLQALEEFDRRLHEKLSAWQKPIHKPVSQVDMKSGGVEMF